MIVTASSVIMPAYVRYGAKRPCAGGAVHDHLSPPAQVSDQASLSDFGAGSTRVPFRSGLKLMDQHLCRTAWSTHKRLTSTNAQPRRRFGSASVLWCGRSA